MNKTDPNSAKWVLRGMSAVALSLIILFGTSTGSKSR